MNSKHIAHEHRNHRHRKNWGRRRYPLFWRDDPRLFSSFRKSVRDAFRVYKASARDPFFTRGIGIEEWSKTHGRKVFAHNPSVLDEILLPIGSLFSDNGSATWCKVKYDDKGDWYEELCLKLGCDSIVPRGGITTPSSSDEVDDSDGEETTIDVKGMTRAQLCRKNLVTIFNKNPNAQLSIPYALSLKAERVLETWYKRLFDEIVDKCASVLSIYTSAKAIKQDWGNRQWVMDTVFKCLRKAVVSVRDVEYDGKHDKLSEYLLLPHSVPKPGSTSIFTKDMISEILTGYLMEHNTIQLPQALGDRGEGNEGVEKKMLLSPVDSYIVDRCRDMLADDIASWIMDSKDKYIMFIKKQKALSLQNNDEVVETVVDRDSTYLYLADRLAYHLSQKHPLIDSGMRTLLLGITNEVDGEKPEVIQVDQKSQDITGINSESLFKEMRNNPKLNSVIEKVERFSNIRDASGYFIVILPKKSKFDPSIHIVKDVHRQIHDIPLVATSGMHITLDPSNKNTTHRMEGGGYMFTHTKVDDDTTTIKKSGPYLQHRVPEWEKVRLLLEM